MISSMMKAVGVYTRLSDEDGRNTESRSIETQREICLRYAKERGWTVREVFVDDGYSGTNFDRPAYQEMKDQIENGHIDCIIVKDLSRFGRNAAKMTLELESFNDNYGIRFVSVTEDIDAVSTNDYNEVFQIVLVLNEMYPRDCSKKILAAWKNGVANGKFMYGTAPFGYQRGENNRLIMEVDPVAAECVKRVFRDYAAGHNMRQIAEKLNQEGVPSPRAYYYQKVGRNNPNSEKETWGSNSIRNMLENEAYRGVLIQGKRRTVSYKNKNRKMVPSENWNRTENAHESIIDEILWETVQSKRKEGTFTRRQKNGNVGVFSGLLRCGKCGSALALTMSRETAVYRCNKYNTNGRTACAPHRINEEMLKKVLAEEISRLAVLAEDEENELAKRIADHLQVAQSDTTQALVKKQQKIKHKIDVNQAATKTLFEDRGKGKIPDNIFFSQIEHFSKELENFKEELNEIQAQVSKKKNEGLCVQKWIDIVKKHIDLMSVDRVVATELIDHIIVHESFNESGQRILDLDIYYRFVGNINATKKDITCCEQVMPLPQITGMLQNQQAM